jgi:predicted HTH domain antitoxin
MTPWTNLTTYGSTRLLRCCVIDLLQPLEMCYVVDDMVEITIKLPESLAEAFGQTTEVRALRLAEDAAIEGYRSGRLSHRQVGEMLGLDYWQTERFLAERKVAINYSVDDLQADRATLDEILPRK